VRFKAIIFQCWQRNATDILKMLGYLAHRFAEPATTHNIPGRPSPHCDFNCAGQNIDDIAIGLSGHPVDDKEIGGVIKNDQRMVPGARAVVHALVATGRKSANGIRIKSAAGRHNDQPAASAKGNKRLAAQDVAFHHRRRQGHLPGLTGKYIERRSPLPLSGVNISKVMKAGRHAVIDFKRISAGLFDHIAKGGKGVWAEGNSSDFARHVQLSGMRIGPAGPGTPIALAPWPRRPDASSIGKQIKSGKADGQQGYT